MEVLAARWSTTDGVRCLKRSTRLRNPSADFGREGVDVLGGEDEAGMVPGDTIDSKDCIAGVVIGSSGLIDSRDPGPMGSRRTDAMCSETKRLLDVKMNRVYVTFATHVTRRPPADDLSLNPFLSFPFFPLPTPAHLIYRLYPPYCQKTCSNTRIIPAMATTAANGLPTPPQTEKTASSIASPPRIILSGKTGRILCVADIRGDCE